MSDLDTRLAEELLEAATIVMRSAAASLQMWDPERAELVLLAWRGFHPESAAFWRRVRLGSATACGQALRSGGRVLTADVDDDAELAGAQDLVEFRRSGLRSVQSTPLIAGDGRLLGMMSTHWREPHRPGEPELRVFDVLTRQAAEIVERRRSEGALRASEERLRAALSIETVGVLSFRSDGRVLDANPAFERMSGFTLAELRSLSHWDRLTPTEFRPALAHATQALVAGREAPPYERQLLRKDGSRFWGLCAPRVVASDGSGCECIEVIIDISEQKRADLAKDEFLAVLGHELRTPLSAIFLWAGALRAGNLPLHDVPRAVEAITECAQSQLRLIEDLLDLSRLTAGRLALRVTPVDVAAVARGVLAMVKQSALAKRLTLVERIEGDLGEPALDGNRFKQVLWNLLSNAIKFTPEGGTVTLAVRRAGAALEVEVADSGEGIAPEFLPHVFEKFRQGDMAETRRHMGLGIGLSLSRQLVELHGGSIEVRSAGVGRGSTFLARLPWNEPESVPALDFAPEQRRPLAPLSGVEVLLVEDDTNTREAMQWMLKRSGATVVAVASAAEGLAAIEAERAPQLIVSDLALPDLSGYELISEVALRYEAMGRPLPPACAVSAHARDTDRERAIAAGFDLYLTKPLAPERFIDALVELREVTSA